MNKMRMKMMKLTQQTFFLMKRKLIRLKKK